VRGVNVVEGIGEEVRVEIMEVVVEGENRIEDHEVVEEIQIVGEVIIDNNLRKSCPKMWGVNLWEGGMQGVILVVQGEAVDLSDVMTALLVKEVLAWEVEEMHPQDNDHHSSWPRVRNHWKRQREAHRSHLFLVVPNHEMNRLFWKRSNQI
jgi:predicted Rossmann-fold nucleotide-binding protein